MFLRIVCFSRLVDFAKENLCKNLEQSVTTWNIFISISEVSTWYFTIFFTKIHLNNIIKIKLLLIFLVNSIETEFSNDKFFFLRIYNEHFKLRYDGIAH